jgi:hypothetical protein
MHRGKQLAAPAVQAMREAPKLFLPQIGSHVGSNAKTQRTFAEARSPALAYSLICFSPFIFARSTSAFLIHQPYIRYNILRIVMLK